MSQDIKKIFSKNLNRMMESRGETLSDLSASIDVAFSTVSDWKNAKKMPRSAALQKIAEHYNVNISDLTSDFENSQNFKASEAYIPLMGIVTAGQPLEMYDNPEEIQVPVDIANAYPNSYLLQVDGDSMNKLVPDGSYVLIQKTKELDSGEAAERWGKAEDYVRQMYRKYPDKFPPGTIRKFGKQIVVTREGMESATGQKEASQTD